ncbi:Gfo/Idh/MocA family protein [Nocardia rhamnosiphila]|uniref:Gfo/Idh/MocA family oxidoreductase n=1 Tax=Nocardia rhamnosiphila TaxID=426716 RepID=A0ABV2WYS1_9NOCA
MNRPDSSDRALTAAVVGTGWGCLTHVPAIKAAGTQVRTLVGTDPERTRRRAELSEVPDWTTDLDSVLADPGLDIVVVATPPHTHADIVLKAVAAGKHVVCEKPFATNLADAVRMRDAARDQGVIHAVGHEFRWQPHMAATSQAVRGGEIGNPSMITHVRINSILAGPAATAPDWFQNSGSFGGWPNAEIQHVIDELRTAVGEFASVTALEGQVTEHAWDAAETFLVQFTMENGAMGVIQSSVGAFGPMVNTQRLTGTKGSIWTTPEGVVMLHDGTAERIVEPPAHLLNGDGPQLTNAQAAALSGGDTLSTALSGATVRFLRPTQLLHEAFREAVLGRERTAWPPLPTFDDGVANTAVHEAIRRSIATGRPQDVRTIRVG